MRTIINDTCEVVAKRLSDNKIIFTATAQLASLSQKVQTDRVKGGIGNKDVAILRSSKETELSVRNAVFDSDWLEMVCGASFSSATNTVFKKESVTCSTANTLTISTTPKTGSIVKAIASDGTQINGTFTATTVTATGATVGKTYNVLYQVDVTGNTLNIDASKFSERFALQYNTIEYDIDTNVIKNDLYLQFDSCMPQDDFDLSFENGKAQTPEFKFIALAPANSNVIGRIIEIAR